VLVPKEPKQRGIYIVNEAVIKRNFGLPEIHEQSIVLAAVAQGNHMTDR